MAPKIIAVSGSARKESLNKKLLALAVAEAERQGLEVTVVDLRDYTMPLYDGDDEEENGLPEAAKALKQLFIAHDGLLISSPEYNSSISPLLKNTLDWISRPESDDEPSLIAYRGKLAALLSASPGNLGGLRGLIPLRMLLENIGVMVIPQQFCLSQAQAAFQENGEFKNPNQQKKVVDVISSFTEKLNLIGNKLTSTSSRA